MSEVIELIREELKKNADEKTRESGHRYFKEAIKLYGVKTALVTQISKEQFKNVKSMPKAEVLNLCEELWKSGFMEESFIACNWSYYVRKDYEPDDFNIFENWVSNYVSNWAACDTLCNHTIGAFIENYPEYLNELKKWAKSDNYWVRRASAVTLIIPARHGKFLEDVFEIADLLLLDKEDLVQKGYGWMLKEASRTHQKEVFDYVVNNKAVMPRTALRYAIEKMPEDLRKAAMKK
ncbi:MAG: DNA alkylation repair protein [Chitinophagales bacterium]